jgi:hypothetical protein
MRLPRWLPTILILLGAGAPSAAAALATERVAQMAPDHLAWLLLTSASVLLVGLVLSARARFVPPVVRTRIQLAVLAIGAVVLAMQVAMLLLFFRPYLWSR